MKAFQGQITSGTEELQSPTCADIHVYKPGHIGTTWGPNIKKTQIRMSFPMVLDTF